MRHGAVVLDRDYFSMAEDEIVHVESDLTLLGGQVVWGAVSILAVLEVLFMERRQAVSGALPASSVYGAARARRRPSP